ncbi:uncharacterized protein LOC135340933 isoform X2 [Halichondria panicea]|uniref:uncharacterized protein LOC135340933 isoform X2 n=1 Tax=Halichondria panicea TaxID=6063 RepID=UPI00312BA6F3
MSRLLSAAASESALQIRVVEGGETKHTLPLSCIRSIEVHQPIFSANYISGEYSEQDSTTTFTITFNQGGATDFARAFFRLTEGQLVTKTTPNEPTVPSEEKKTK